jgi:hypothetical protein
MAFSASEGMTWKPVLIHEGNYWWILSDKKITAQCGTPGNVVVIQDRNFNSDE